MAELIQSSGCPQKKAAKRRFFLVAERRDSEIKTRRGLVFISDAMSLLEDKLCLDESYGGIDKVLWLPTKKAANRRFF